MSLRKFISLLLLVSFVFTTVSPAFAETTLSLSPSTLPTLAEDDGTVATHGANRDVVPANIRITATAETDVVFCGDSGLLNGQAIAAFADMHLRMTANGKIIYTNGTDATVDFGASRCVAGIKPPTGTKFVKLTGGATAYDETTRNASTAYAGTVNGTEYLRNVSVSNVALLPGASSTNGAVIIASVLTSTAAASLFGDNSTSLPAGSIVLGLLSPISNTTSNDLQSTGTISLTLTGIGLASDGNGTLADSGNITATYIAPDAASQTNGQAALPNLTHATTFNVATLAATGDKLEVLTVGTDIGNDSAPTAEPDSQPNTILASLVTGSTVKIGPGEFTKGGSTGYLDTDALVIRAKERPDSTSSAVTHYETPFATSKVVLTGGPLSNTGTNADTLQTTALTDTGVFPNSEKALITVVFSLEDGTATASTAGGSSSATLAVDAVNVTMHGPRAFNGIRATATTDGGQTHSAVTTPSGYLGAAINLENGTTSGYTNYVAMVLYNGDSTIDDYDVADVAVLNQDALAAKHGAVATSFYTANYDSNVLINNGTTTLGIFPGSLVAHGQTATTGSYNLVNTANGQTAGSEQYKASYASTTGLSTASLLATPTDLTARLLNGTSGASIGNTAWFILSGNDAGGAMNVAGRNIVAATNPGASAYDTGFTAKTAAATTTPLNNVIMAAELEGATLKILPVINKYDNIRDALSIRPEITVTLDDAAKTAGVKLIATVSGNNIASTTRIVMANILASGTFDPGIDLTANALPVHGNTGSDHDLMAESSTDAGASRAALDISSVTGASTTTDSLSDQLATGSVLDDTTPPLFCGGAAGTTTRGPNGLVVQPKARAILLTENGGTGFDQIEDLGSNAVIRFTLPSGWDINEYTATATDFLAIETSGGLSASIDKVEPISTTVSQAFVDVSSVDSSTVTQSGFNRLMALFFDPHALLVPEGTDDFGVTVAVYDDKGTAAYTDDVLVGTLGTVQMASACSTFLEISFCPDKLSDFDDSSVTTPTLNSVESNHVTRGSRETTYASAVGPALRVVTSTANLANITLPDVCITEGVADAIPLGSATSAGSTGVPTTFGDVSANPGAVRIHIATSFAGDSSTGLVGISNGSGIAATSILFSDGSIEADTGVHNMGGADNANNEVAFEVDTRSLTGNELPFEEITRIRIPGLVLEKPDAAASFTDQNLIAWVEVAETASTVTSGLTAGAVSSDSVVVGSSLAGSISEVTASTNEYFLNPFDDGSSDGRAMRNLFYSKTVDDTSTGNPTDVDWEDLATDGDNDITVVLAGGNPAILEDATRSEVDSTSSFLELDGDTKISVLTSAITGTTAVNAQVSVGPGTLEPGTLITVDGTVDDVIVPVLADGSFQANIRCSAGTSINLSQSPESSAITTPALGSATCDDQNVDPILLSAVVSDIGLGTITEAGTAPVVFTVTASGKVDGDDFVPTADQLTLGGNPVIAVDGTTDQFIGIVNFNKSSGKIVATTVGDGSSVTLSGIDSAAATQGGAPSLTKVKANKKGKVILKGLRLSNKGLAYFVLDDGTIEPLDLARRNKKDAQRNRRRGEDGASIPSNATHAVFHVSGKGVSTIEL